MAMSRLSTDYPQTGESPLHRADRDGPRIHPAFDAGEQFERAAAAAANPHTRLGDAAHLRPAVVHRLVDADQPPDRLHEDADAVVDGTPRRHAQLSHPLVV